MGYRVIEVSCAPVQPTEQKASACTTTARRRT